MNDFFSSNYRNSESKFLEGLNKWLFCRKKLNKKNLGNKKGGKTRTVLQKRMNK